MPYDVAMRSDRDPEGKTFKEKFTMAQALDKAREVAGKELADGATSVEFRIRYLGADGKAKY